MDLTSRFNNLTNKKKMTPKITLSKNKSAPAPWFTSWRVGDLTYLSIYKDGEEHTVQLVDPEGLKPFQECLEAAGFAPKYDKWFSVGSNDGQYFIEWSKDGEETKTEISMHGAFALKDHFLSLGYEWR